jgi:hypothetical protein
MIDPTHDDGEWRRCDATVGLDVKPGIYASARACDSGDIDD